MFAPIKTKFFAEFKDFFFFEATKIFFNLLLPPPNPCEKFLDPPMTVFLPRQYFFFRQKTILG